MTPRPPELVKRPKRNAARTERTPLTAVPGIAPRAHGTEVVFGFDGPIAVGLDLRDVPAQHRREMLAAFLEADHNADALQEEAVI